MNTSKIFNYYTCMSTLQEFKENLSQLIDYITIEDIDISVVDDNICIKLKDSTESREQTYSIIAKFIGFNGAGRNESK